MSGWGRFEPPEPPLKYALAQRSHCSCAAWMWFGEDEFFFLIIGYLGMFVEKFYNYGLS